MFVYIYIYIYIYIFIYIYIYIYKYIYIYISLLNQLHSLLFCAQPRYTQHCNFIEPITNFENSADINFRGKDHKARKRKSKFLPLTNFWKSDQFLAKCPKAVFSQIYQPWRFQEIFSFFAMKLVFERFASGAEIKLKILILLYAGGLVCSSVARQCYPTHCTRCRTNTVVLEQGSTTIKRTSNHQLQDPASSAMLSQYACKYLEQKYIVYNFAAIQCCKIISRKSVRVQYIFHSPV